MSDLQERMIKLVEAAKADEEFDKRLAAAFEAQDKDAIIALAAEKDIAFTADEFGAPDLEGKEMDEAELEAVAGGKDWEELAKKIDNECHYSSAAVCGFFFGVAAWGVTL